MTSTATTTHAYTQYTLGNPLFPPFPLQQLKFDWATHRPFVYGRAEQRSQI